MFLCEVMIAKAEDAALQSHQERWDCWARESVKVPACVLRAKLGPLDDADYCAEAVAFCKAGGFDERADRAEERMFTWYHLAAALRFVVLVSAVGALLWFGVGRFARRPKRS